VQEKFDDTEKLIGLIFAFYKNNLLNNAKFNLSKDLFLILALMVSLVVLGRYKLKALFRILFNLMRSHVKSNSQPNDSRENNCFEFNERQVEQMSEVNLERSLIKAHTYTCE
jgi:predicted membrane protein